MVIILRSLASKVKYYHVDFRVTRLRLVRIKDILFWVTSVTPANGMGSGGPARHKNLSPIGSRTLPLRGRHK